VLPDSRSIKPGSNVFGSQRGYVGTVQAAGERLIRVVGCSPDKPTYFIPIDAVAHQIAPGEFVLECTIQELGSKCWQGSSVQPHRPVSACDFVYARHGAYVGVVESATGDVMRVQGPGPDAAVYYIPIDAIAGELGGGREVFLDCSSDELSSKGWLTPRRGLRL
jgi:hypothetical protein